MTLPIGTLTNVGAILTGGCVGLLLHQRLPKRVQVIVFQAIGLFTLLIGFRMAFKVNNLLTLVFSLLIGGVLGEAIRLDKRFDQLGGFLKKKFHFEREPLFTEGLITTSLLFCTGSLAILGAIDEGLRQDPTLLWTKSILDGFSAVALASAYGIGVLFSVIPLFLYQGAITFLASSAQNIFSTLMIQELTATGGLLLVALGINLLDIKKINVTNLLPAVVISALLTLLASALGAA